MLVKKSRLSNTQAKVCNPCVLHFILYFCTCQNLLHNVYLQLLNEEISSITLMYTHKYHQEHYTHTRKFVCRDRQLFLLHQYQSEVHTPNVRRQVIAATQNVLYHLGHRKRCVGIRTPCTIALLAVDVTE